MWWWTVFIALSAGAVPSEKPFWQTKEKAIERIKDREILVVVKSAPKDQGKLLLAQGGGRVKAPAEFTFQRAQDYEQLPNHTRFIEEAVFNQKAQELTIKVSAFGYRDRFRIKLDVRDKLDPKEVGYEVIEGSLKGFRGLFWFQPLDSKTSEVGLEGRLIYDTIPVPKIFIEFGMEVVMQRLAGKLREYTEGEFKKREARP